MTPLVSVEQFLSRVSSSVILPLDDTDEPDAVRIEVALTGATGIIVAHLPWLLDKETGEIARPINPQFADALTAVCADIAIDRMTDVVSGSENTRNRYKESLSLLDKIDREYQGGLSGPDYQEASVIDAAKDSDIDDSRFWQKGGIY
jgi:phage gp36-like protein